MDPMRAVLTAEDLRRYEAIEREPLARGYRGSDVLTNPRRRRAGPARARPGGSTGPGPAGLDASCSR